MATEHKASRELQWVEQFAGFMDSKFVIPGTKIRFGLDPVIGLVPVIGDIASFAISGFLLLIMARHGASRKVVILMTLNILIDTVLGSIPLLGNVFDVFFRANDRNIRLLRKHYVEGKYQGSGKGIILGIILFLLVILCLMFYGLYKLVEFIIHLIHF